MNATPNRRDHVETVALGRARSDRATIAPSVSPVHQPVST